MERTVESAEGVGDLLLLRMKNADFLLVELLNWPFGSDFCNVTYKNTQQPEL